MRVGNVEPVKDRLDRAVLAEAAVQRVEHDVGLGLQRGDQGAEVLANLDRPHVEPGLAQCDDDLCAAGQAYLALGRDAAVKYGDAGHATTSGLRPGRPIRRISQLRPTPLAAATRRRTSSPRPSRSAAVALPVLMRKLQCFSETCAPPRTRPRQPAASI